jgi:hypothetical protein
LWFGSLLAYFQARSTIKIIIIPKIAIISTMLNKYITQDYFGKKHPESDNVCLDVEYLIYSSRVIYDFA